ncbi:hypothetical protein N7481_006897 [Penicillium waksmanii]|uniref:uncharacterized protein n=1 Tax=Penicillium waksmanii TaxID=69791 RepID=UPI002547C553|nr:uncharacterized protein N7481_006897 [Penicillium waksmanii]KAJ5979599.1 hypothetical protein N7481_006897 [Penicillium waksmanii]
MATRQALDGGIIRRKACGERICTLERRDTGSNSRNERLQIMAVSPSDIVVDGSVNRCFPILGYVDVWQDERTLHKIGNLQRNEAQGRHADVIIVASLYNKRVHTVREGWKDTLRDVEWLIAGNGPGVRFADGENAER